MNALNTYNEKMTKIFGEDWANKTTFELGLSEKEAQCFNMLAGFVNDIVENYDALKESANTAVITIDNFHPIKVITYLEHGKKVNLMLNNKKYKGVISRSPSKLKLLDSHAVLYAEKSKRSGVDFEYGCYE